MCPVPKDKQGFWGCYLTQHCATLPIVLARRPPKQNRSNSKNEGGAVKPLGSSTKSTTLNQHVQDVGERRWQRRMSRRALEPKTATEAEPIPSWVTSRPDSGR